MKKKKILIMSIAIFCAFFTKLLGVNAQTISFNIKSGTTEWTFPDHADYKYAVVEFSATEGAKTQMYFQGANNELSFVKTLGNSPKFTLKSWNKVYILPRSGMACPSDATRCFGAGLSNSQTTLITRDFATYGLRFVGGDANYSGTISYYS